ncbi:MAG: hypothetical protein ACI8WB_004403 [Phenylobacterium sp.]|jgi:hypothetical protein
MCIDKPTFSSVFWLLSGAIMLLTLSSCSIVRPYFSQQDDEQTFAGSGTIFHDDAFTDLNLCNTLIQFGLAEIVKGPTLKLKKEAGKGILPGTGAVPDSICIVRSGVANDKPTKLEIKNDGAGKASITFENTENITVTNIHKVAGVDNSESDMIATTEQWGPKIPEYEAKRNNFVSYVMALSEQKCGAYKTFLLRDKAKLGTVLGTFSTLFAGASAVLTHGATVSAFAAGSSAFSGINGVYAQERFASLTLEVITAGIEQRRKDMADDIRNKFSHRLTQYPVGYAIKDALGYHAACTAVTGLEVAKDSISRVDDPGIKQFQKTLKDMDMDLEVKATNK